MARTARDSVTIGEVASAAGVSRATVSRVMNGRSTVQPRMAQRVRAAAAELQYRPSSVARSLSLGRTDTVAFVVPDLSNPMFQQILRGTMASAAPHGYRMLVAESPENPEDEAESALEARLRCDALVLVSPRMNDVALTNLLSLVRPAVLVNRVVAESRTPALLVDYDKGITEIIDHLVSLGHRDLAYLSGPSNSTSNNLRMSSLRAAALRYPGLVVRTLRGGATVNAGYSAADAVLSSHASAVIAFNDLVAFGLLARLNESGVAVPEDISVVGFDDIELARYATPPLTTAAVPQVGLGGRAWELLQDVINGDTSSHQRIHFTPRLVVRASTGPVPAARRVTFPKSGLDGVDARLPSAATTVPTWRLEGTGAVLPGPHGVLARYQLGDRMPQVHAPRPYLHPVRTLDGIALTETSPRDHRHHYGLSIAVADVNGTSHWGGRTYVRDEGPTLLQNHGRQVSAGLRAVNDATAGVSRAARGGNGEVTDPHESGLWLVDDVQWFDQHGAAQLHEERIINGCLLPQAEAWALHWRSLLRADHGPLRFDSPATNGRFGAGYGGLFWRLPIAQESVVLTDRGAGEENAHGSSSPWLAIAQRRADTWTTLVRPSRRLCGCRPGPGLGRAPHGLCRWSSRARPHGCARRSPTGPGRLGGSRRPRPFQHHHPGLQPRTGLAALPPCPRRLMPSLVDSTAGATPTPGGRALLPGEPTFPPTRVALVGAHGHGASHLRRIAELADRGVAELCAVADPRPADPRDAPPDAPWYASLDELLARQDTAPDVVVLSTPLPTHLLLAQKALRAGCDVLLEKPTTVSFAEYERLIAVVQETGRRCQVGFQSFGSNVFAEIDRVVASGEIGEVTGIGAVGTWVRTAGYWARAPWAGRRLLDGAEVNDGVVTNPLAHAVATALRVGGVTQASHIRSVETDLYRANPIDADDTSSVRVVSDDGRSFGFGLTLCAPERSPARVMVQGTRGELTLFYETDRMQVRTPAGAWSLQSQRTDLLADLLVARRDPAARLRCDVRDTGAFMRVLEAVRTAPDPTPIGASFVTWSGSDTERRPVVHDVEAWCERAARDQSTFRTLGAPWAVAAS